MALSISFSKPELVKLDQIIAQFIHYADGNTDAVGGLDERDLGTVKTNAENFRENMNVWLNRFDTYDGTTQDADYTD